MLSDLEKLSHIRACDVWGRWVNQAPQSLPNA